MKWTAVAVACAWVCCSSTAVRGQPIPESVYPPPEPTIVDDPREASTGAHFDLSVLYSTDYVWRGIERFDAGRREDESNLQFDARLSFDLGKLPHPYVNLFVNTAEGDPVTNFEEVRPELGFDWNVRPITISAGYTTYKFPDRSTLDSSEVFLRFQLDDSLVFRTAKPLLSPYVFGAYDIDLYDGLYVEAGVEHAWPIEDTSLTFLFNAHAAYVNGYDLFSQDVTVSNSGFQHWQAGITVRYDLNGALNLPDRFGQFALEGFVNYTGEIEKDLVAEDQLWGGAGITLRF